MAGFCFLLKIYAVFLALVNSCINSIANYGKKSVFINAETLFEVPNFKQLK